MITQYIEELPEGKTHPDFTRKPIALTIQEGRTDSTIIILKMYISKYKEGDFPESVHELDLRLLYLYICRCIIYFMIQPCLSFFSGKFAYFKAIVTGDPQPTVTWSRNNGDVSDTARYQTKYDPITNDHTFEASQMGFQIAGILYSKIQMLVGRSK